MSVESLIKEQLPTSMTPKRRDGVTTRITAALAKNGWLKDKPGGLGEMSVHDAASVLLRTTGLDATRKDLAAGNADLVNAVYQSAAQRHHRDRGGSPTVFSAIAKARNVLLANTALVVPGYEPPMGADDEAMPLFRFELDGGER